MTPIAYTKSRTGDLTMRDVSKRMAVFCGTAVKVIPGGRRPLIALTAIAVLATGCAETMSGMGPKQQVGMVAGGAGLAALASKIGKANGTMQLVLTVLGGAAGAALGGGIGQSLDNMDRVAAL